MKINELLVKCNNCMKNYKNTNIIAFLIFSFLIILVSFFHEPWYDEFQSWGISRDSLHNILFVIPHYEGHPPLWHLILKCFSYFNIDAELCLKIPNTIFTMLTAWLIIYKSPFPKLVSVSLPFTYFIFYQYGIICRPYSLLTLGIVLCAVMFEKRNTNPFKFASVLALISLTSAIGMAIAAGITVAWGLEFIKIKELKQSIVNLIKSKSFLAMILLLICCILITAIIYPDSQNTAAPLLRFLTLPQKIVYCVFGAIADATVFDIIHECSYIHLSFLNLIEIIYILCGIIFGLLLNIFLIIIFKKCKMLGYFLIPYLLLICMFIIYYFSHHSGIVFLLIVFNLWINYDSLLQNLSVKQMSILKNLTVFVFLIQLTWSMVAGVSDILWNYEYSKEMANYIKRNKLCEYNLFAGGWHAYYYIAKDGTPIFNKYIKNKNNELKLVPTNEINAMYLAVNVNPYFNKNIFYNFNIKNPDKLYSLHKTLTEKEKKELISEWQKKGEPDFIFGNIDFDFMGLKRDNYMILKKIETRYIWKFISFIQEFPIFVRKDLFFRFYNQD